MTELTFCRKGFQAKSEDIIGELGIYTGVFSMAMAVANWSTILFLCFKYNLAVKCTSLLQHFPSIKKTDMERSNTKVNHSTTNISHQKSQVHCICVWFKLTWIWIFIPAPQACGMGVRQESWNGCDKFWNGTSSPVEEVCGPQMLIFHMKVSHAWQIWLLQ